MSYPYPAACPEFSNREESAEAAFRVYHDGLMEDARPSRLNEPYIDSRLRELDAFVSLRQDLYWLSIAQIGELALYCAGQYADAVEFQAAGDILANPRLILVHDRDGKQTRVKQRHRALSSQFHEKGETRYQTLCRLAGETSLGVRKDALLPALYARMKDSHFLSGTYLFSFQKRINKVIKTMGFLAAWQIENCQELFHRLQRATPSERLWIESNLCRFDMKIFINLGHHIQSLIPDGRYQSKFIRRGLKADMH
jgi:hypothetical protein